MSEAKTILNNMSEAKIQVAIIRNLEKAGWYVVKLIQTNKNGIPDLMCIKGKIVHFVEVKATGKKPNELQQYRMAELLKAGCRVTVTDKVITDL